MHPFAAMARRRSDAYVENPFCPQPSSASAWAIGTGVAATAAQAQETHKGIRDWIEEYVDEKTAHEIRIQYGGSATAENAPELSNYPDIDGFLVGGASLKPEICEIVKEIAVAKNTFAMGGA